MHTFNKNHKAVPSIGFELTTYRLQGDCSTTELTRLLNLLRKRILFANKKQGKEEKRRISNWFKEIELIDIVQSESQCIAEQ